MSSPTEIRNWISTHLDALIDDDYKKGLSGFVPGAGKITGVPVPKLRVLAREAQKDLKPTPEIWAKCISFVIPDRHREMILTGAFGLGKKASQLDDLFGERASGWGRELDNWETVDQLSVPVGAWVLADLSRIGYLESWAAHGETVWKKRLGVVSTVQLNHGGHSHSKETLKVVRHVMETDDKMLIKAAGWALREIKDQETLERFLTEWAPECKKTLLTQSMKELPKANQKRITGMD